MRKIFSLTLAQFLILLISCGDQMEINKEKIDQIAEAYVKLSLKAGQLDPDFVDAYHGPEEWKPNEELKQGFEELIIEIDNLLDKLENIDTGKFDSLWKLRHNYLTKQLIAAKTRLKIVSGVKIKFDEQTTKIFDATAPTYDNAHFLKLIEELDNALPGRGDLNERLNQFKSEFVIPTDKLDVVFNAAIEECRKRTLEYINLPENESFTVEYVKNQPWGAYNWYKGNFYSVIQVNTDLPKYIDSAIDLAAHEGYPGHHVYNALLEKTMLKEKGWIEFSVYNLFSPQSLIAEGTANYGIDVAFPNGERIKFEKEVLFPLAGLDTAKANDYYKILELAGKLNYATNEAARNYLDGKISKDEAVEWLKKYRLATQARAEQNLNFIKRYQSYVINYNLGEDIVKKFVEEKAGKDKTKRWEVFIELLTTPQTSSTLN